VLEQAAPYQPEGTETIMARKAESEKPMDQINIDTMSNEELQSAILRVELETKVLGLAEAKKRNADFTAKEEQRHAANKKRMTELTVAKNNHDAVVKECRHKSGGSPNNKLRGGGRFSFSLITRAIMPDGVTILLQCPRCRMKKYPPQQSLKKEDPKLYLKELDEYNELLEQSIEEGLEHAEMRGPTFMFKNEDGVPIIPERV